MAFFTTVTSSDLEKTLVLKDVDVFIQKFEFIGAGVASIATDDITLTPAISPAFTINELASTVADNIVVLADSSKLLQGPIDSNIATALTFDATGTTDVSDGTAGAASDFTVTTSYDFYALTASDDNEFGDFLGWTAEVTINDEEEMAQFKNGVPRSLKTECLLERTITVTGQIANITRPDVIRTLFNLTDRGLQTAQTESHTGYNPADRDFYRISLVGEDKNAQEYIYQFFKGKIRMEGGLNLGEEGFKNVGFTFQGTADTLRPDAFDAYRWRKKD